MNRPTKITIALALFGSLTACTQSGDVFEGVGAGYTSASSSHMTVRRDRGGSLVHYAKRTERLRNRNQVVRFAGRCESACTLYLSLPRSQTCLLPGATFGFHKPYGGNMRQNAEASRFMMASYPGWVRDWVNARGGLSTSMKVMSSAYASQYIPQCGKSQRT